MAVNPVSIMAERGKQMMNRRNFMKSLGLGVCMTKLAGCSRSTLMRRLPSEITEFSATQLSNAIKHRHVSCVEVMRSYLSRIDRYNGVYNAIVSMPQRDLLIAQAKEADMALSRKEYWGWMHGMPYAVKDLSDVRGMITTHGSPIFENNIASSDAIFVERIRRQGAIFIGKTNVPEFGVGSQTYNPVFGVTRNAYDPALCAGGSSGGAAMCLAGRLLPVADGSDMMGSLRNPAAFNNVIGFRPSFGRVPRKDRNVFYQQLGYEGPMGRNVEDTERLLLTMAGYDARAPLSLRDSLSISKDRTTGGLDRFRLGWLGDFNGYLAMEPGVLDVCHDNLQHLASLGLVVEECQPLYEPSKLWNTWLTLRHWTIAGSARVLYDNPHFRALLKCEIIWEIEGGLRLTGMDVSAAAKARSDWYAVVRKLFEKYDFIALPSAQVFAFDAAIQWPEKVADRNMDTYHRWMEIVIGGTLSGCPVLNLPVGFDPHGRAMGMQVIAPAGEDSALLEFAYIYEANTDYLQQQPRLVEHMMTPAQMRTSLLCGT